MNTDTKKARHARREETLQNTPEVKRLKRKIGFKNGLFEIGDFTLLILQSATVLLAVFAAIPFLFQVFMGAQFNVVLSGSMSGTAEVGELVQTKPYMGEQLAVGTIVGIEQGDTLYTHRIVKVVTDETTGKTSYVTKGDANNTQDLFKPTGDHIWGVVANIIHQPLASVLTVFSWNTQWMDGFSKAAIAGNFDAINALLPTAPWGLLILIVAVLLFWWILPDILTSIRSKQARRDELAMTLLKRQVPQHEEAIEVEPTPVEEEPLAESVPFPTNPARVEDDLVEFLPEVGHAVALPELEPEPSPSTPASRAEEIGRRLMRTLPDVDKSEGY